MTETDQGKPWLRPAAEMLRRLHDESGITGKGLAAALGCGETKISRVRGAVVSPGGEFAAAWARVCRADDWQVAEILEALVQVPQLRYDLAEEQPVATSTEAQHDRDKLLAESRHIRYFDIAWIPEILQTRGYAPRALREIWELDGREKDLEGAVFARMRRQTHLHDPSKTFQIMVHESALTQGTISAEIMTPQLYVLLGWLNAPNVQFAVLPLRGRNRRTPVIGFQMYDEMAIAEDLIGEWERPADKYAQLFKDMWSAAAVGEDARPFIENAITESRGGTS